MEEITSYFRIQGQDHKCERLHEKKKRRRQFATSALKASAHTFHSESVNEHLAK
jgi:hypothetical protein